MEHISFTSEYTVPFEKDGFPFLFDTSDSLCRFMRLNWATLELNLYEFIGLLLTDPDFGSSLMCRVLKAGLLRLISQQQLNDRNWDSLERCAYNSITSSTDAMISSEMKVDHSEKTLIMQECKEEHISMESDRRIKHDHCHSHSHSHSFYSSNLNQRLPMVLKVRLFDYLTFNEQLICSQVCRDFLLISRDVRCNCAVIKPSLFSQFLTYHYYSLRHSDSSPISFHSLLHTRLNVTELNVLADRKFERVFQMAIDSVDALHLFSDDSDDDDNDDYSLSKRALNAVVLAHSQPFSNVVFRSDLKSLQLLRHLSLDGEYSMSVFPIREIGCHLKSLSVRRSQFSSFVYLLMELPFKVKQSLQRLSVDRLWERKDSLTDIVDDNDNLNDLNSLHWIPEEGLTTELLLFLELLLPHRNIDVFNEEFENYAALFDFDFSREWHSSLDPVFVVWLRMIQLRQEEGEEYPRSSDGGMNSDESEVSWVMDSINDDDLLIGDDKFESLDMNPESKEQESLLTKEIPSEMKILCKLNSHWSNLHSLRLNHLDFAFAAWTDLGGSQTLFELIRVSEDESRVKWAFPALRHLFIGHYDVSESIAPDRNRHHRPPLSVGQPEFSFLFSNLCSTMMKSLDSLQSVHIHGNGTAMALYHQKESIYGVISRVIHLCLRIESDCPNSSLSPEESADGASRLGYHSSGPFSASSALSDLNLSSTTTTTTVSDSSLECPHCELSKIILDGRDDYSLYCPNLKHLTIVIDGSGPSWTMSLHLDPLMQLWFECVRKSIISSNHRRKEDIHSSSKIFQLTLHLRSFVLLSSVMDRLTDTLDEWIYSVDDSSIEESSIGEHKKSDHPSTIVVMRVLVSSDSDQSKDLDFFADQTGILVSLKELSLKLRRLNEKTSDLSAGGLGCSVIFSIGWVSSSLEMTSQQSAVESAYDGTLSVLSDVFLSMEELFSPKQWFHQRRLDLGHCIGTCAHCESCFLKWNEIGQQSECLFDPWLCQFCAH